MTLLVEFCVAALVHGTLVAGLALALERLLKDRASHAMLSWLWFVALLKFFVPFGPSFRFSLSSLVASGQRALDFDPLVTTATASTASAHAPSPPAWSFALCFGYLAAVAVLSFTRVGAWRQLSRQVSGLPEGDAALVRAVREAAAALGLSRLPQVRVGAGPFVMGWWRPTLVLPAGLQGTPACESVLLHELAHLRRGDQWVRLPQIIAQVLFFFWPPVLGVIRRIEFHRELACDEAALRHGALSVTSYARLLLAAQRSTAAGNVQFAVMGITSQSSRLERRIDMLLNLKPGRSMKCSALTLVAWVCVALSGSALAVDAGAKPGYLDKDAIRSVIRSHVTEVRDCYQRSVAMYPALDGKVVVGWEIGPSGTTQRARISSAELAAASDPLAGQQLKDCLVQVVSGWKFPAPDGGGVVVVNYPFFFKDRSTHASEKHDDK